VGFEEDVTGDAGFFFSIFLRCFLMDDLSTAATDSGQLATFFPWPFAR